MNKEPLGLYIFRFVMGMGLFAFMCMLYWSSVLIEDNVNEIRTVIGQIKTELSNLQNAKGILQAQSPEAHTAVKQAAPRSHMDHNLPNLLSIDPFYAETLPNMLPKEFLPEGTFYQTTIAKPENLHPFSQWINVSLWQNLCSVSLAQLKFGRYETFAPNMAIKIEERIEPRSGEPEYWIHLRDDVFWQPLSPKMFNDQVTLAPHFLKKHQLTAHDFKFYYDALMNPYNQSPSATTLRMFYDDIEKFEVLDDLTMVIKWRTHEVIDKEGHPQKKIRYQAKWFTGGLSPLASFVYKFFPDGKKIIPDDSNPNTYRENSVWGQNFGIHWAQNIIPSCGAWTFEGMTERVVQFKRNSDFFDKYAALMDRREVEFKNTPDAEWQSFKNGMTQTYILDPGLTLELQDFLKSSLYKEQAARGLSVNQLEYVGKMYQYVGWNEAKPFFSNAKVRQALSMAIDRKRIIQQNLNGLGIEINGPFSPESSSYNKNIQPWPYDPEKARRLLAEEGWEDHDKDGIIDKEINGVRVPFRFKLTYFVKQPTTKSIAEYIATSLKEIGIIATLNGVDSADISSEFEGKTFDAIILGWVLGTPPEDLSQTWSSEGAKEKGSSNAIGFANQEADEIIAALEFEYDPEKRLNLYHRFGEIIHEEAPYTFLFAPKIKLLYRDQVQNVFLPIDRQDLIPGADIGEPNSSIFWLKQVKG